MADFDPFDAMPREQPAAAVGDARDQPAQQPWVAHLGAIREENRGKQLSIERGFDPAEVTRGYSFISNTFGSHSAHGGAQFLVLGIIPGDIEPAGATIADIDAGL